MAQVGRISGPLLEANLLRQGIANGTQANLSFKNTNSDPSLLKIDVVNNRIGIAGTEAPANRVEVSGTVQADDAFSTRAFLDNLELTTNNINTDSGDIYLDAGEHIQVSNLETEQFYISNNYISTKDTNNDIDLAPNGTGTVEVQSNLNVTGSLHSTGNITLDGNITFGDADTDSVDFNSDVNSNIIPDQPDTYSLGTVYKSWDSLDTKFVNGQELNTSTISVNGINLTNRAGNILYVSKEGVDTNVGDHPGGALLTIQEAIARVDSSTAGPVTIRIAPGVYEENLPLVIPSDVSVQGVDIRNVVVKPAAGSESKDVFHVDDNTTISDLTIKDYQYDSGNNTGYAFRFSPNAVITNRSPYIQNVTVITSGSVTSASDPRGFDQGDAGKGAWIDGAELDSASIEASMLFHAATFITPGVDAITMTNGVRVEWLNSFTYFANKGLYAVNGSTGRTAYGTTNYGAEVRSIGSASVYGNSGAVADGSDTLMYLIQHNFGYIGAGKFVDNDDSRAIQSQEVTELNSGKINFVTTDHTGGFRIGDNFFVDFETGNTTINIDTLTVNQFNALRVNTGASTTVIDGAFIDTGNLILANNLIQSDSGDLNLASATGKINLQNNTGITGNLDISGDFSFGGALNIGGDQATDSLTLNAALDQDFNPHQHQIFSLGSFAKKWLQAHLNKIETPDIDIYDNVIEIKTSNADLELRAAGTGNIRIADSARFTNNVTISGTTNILDDLSITDSVLPIVGDVNQTGNFTVSEDADIGQNINVGASAQFEEILVDDNFITTTTTNTPLELRTSGTGTVNLQDSVNVTNNLTASDTTATNANITLNATADNANIGSIEINDNNISATSTDSNLILNADNKVKVNGTDTVFGQDLTVAGLSVLLGATDITGTLTHTGNRTTIAGRNLTLNGELTVDNVYIEDNFITTTSGNLILQATGDIDIDSNNVEIANVLDVDGVTNLDVTNIDGTITHVGNRTQYGDYTIGGELTVDNVYIEDNFISTTSGDLNLGAIIVPISDIGTADTSALETSILNRSRGINDDLTSFWNEVVNGYARGDINNSGNINIDDVMAFISFTQGNPNAWIQNNIISPIESNPSLYPNYIISAVPVNVPQNDVQIDNNLTVSGLTSLQGTSVTGNITHIGAYNQTGNLDIAGEISNGDILIEDNFITTTETNSDLELRTSGTGEVVIDTADTLTIENNLTVGGTLDYQGFLTINGDVALLGNTQDGSLTVTDDFDVTGTLDISSQAQFEDVRIEDNFITNTLTSSYSVGGTIRLNEVSKVTDSPPVQFLNEFNALWFFNGAYQLDQDATTTTVVLWTPTNNVVDYGAQVGDYFSITKGSTIFIGQITGFIASQQLDGWVYTEVYKTGYIDNNVDEVTEVTVTLGTELIPFGNLELRASGTGEVLVPNNNVQVNNDLFAASISTGDITVNNDLVLNEIVIPPSIIEIDDNFISTKVSNANLELRATGDVIVQENTIIEQNLTVNGDTNLQDTTINGTLTHVGNTTQIGNYDLTGNLTVGTLVTENDVNFGDIEVAGNIFQTTLSNSNLEFGATDGNVQFDSDVQINNNLTVNDINATDIVVTNDFNLEIVELSTDIQFEDNFITTTNTNSNLELRAVGTGSVLLQNIEVNDNIINTNLDSGLLFAPTNNLVINSIAALQIPTGTTAQRIQASDVFLDGGGSISSASILDGGDATTVFGASDTIYNSGASLLASSGNIGDIRFNTEDNVFEGTSSSSTITLGGLYSENRQTSIVADTATNAIQFIINSTSVGEINANGLSIHGMQVDDILLDSNIITTNVSNSDLELRAEGTGNLILDDIELSENKFKNNGNNLIFKQTGYEAVRFGGTYGVVVPTGATIAAPSPAPEIGDTRWNTTIGTLEAWDGTQYVSSAGTQAAVTAQEFDDLLLEYTIIFG